MMISPECFIAEYQDMPYEKLLKVRDELIRTIRHLEKHKMNIPMNILFLHQLIHNIR